MILGRKWAANASMAKTILGVVSITDERTSDLFKDYPLVHCVG